MPRKQFKSKLDRAEAVHGMVQAGMPGHLARSVVTRKPIFPKKKKKP